MNLQENWKGKVERQLVDIEENSINENENYNELDKQSLESSVVLKSHDYSVNSVDNINVSNSNDSQIKMLNLKKNIVHSTPKDGKKNEQLKIKKPSKYIAACSYINEMYDKPYIKNYKHPIVTNGNLLKLLKQSAKKFQLQSTCLFDSNVEIFVHVSKQFKNLYKFRKDAAEENDSNNSFLKIVFNYVQSCNLKKFYHDRFQYIYNNGTIIGDRIFFNENFSSCFAKLLNKFCLSIKINCIDCKTEDVSWHYSISIIVDSICNKICDDESLSKAINMYYNKQCEICGVESICLVSYDVYSYLCYNSNTK